LRVRCSLPARATCSDDFSRHHLGVGGGHHLPAAIPDQREYVSGCFPDPLHRFTGIHLPGIGRERVCRGCVGLNGIGTGRPSSHAPRVATHHFSDRRRRFARRCPDVGRGGDTRHCGRRGGRMACRILWRADGCVGSDCLALAGAAG